MKFEVRTKEFSKIIDKINPFVDKKSTIPILKNVWIQTGSDHIKMTATNLGQAVQLICPARIKEDGNILIGFHQLKNIVKKLKGDSLGFQKNENTVTINQDNFKIEIKYSDILDFPILQIPEKFNGYIHIDVLEMIFTKTLFAISTKLSEREVFKGVYIERKDNMLKAIATNGYVLAIIKFVPVYNSKDFSFILPREAVVKMCKLMDFDKKKPKSGYFGEESYIKFHWTENKIVFKISEEKFFWANLTTGVYPKMEKAITSNYNILMKANRERIIEILSKIYAFTAPENNGIVLDLSHNVLKISNSLTELEKKDLYLGDASEEMKVSCDGEIKIGLNAGYLLSILQNSVGESVEFKFIDSLSPVLICSEEDKRLLFLIMPRMI